MDYVYGLRINWHLGTSLGHRGQGLVMRGVVVLMVGIDWCLGNNPPGTQTFSSQTPGSWREGVCFPESLGNNACDTDLNCGEALRL